MKDTKIDTTLDLLETIHKTCIDKVPTSLTYDSKNMQVPYMFSLYSIAIELTGDSYQAVKCRKELASHVLTRALLEAIVDLLNVINSPDYVNTRFQKALTERKKKLKYLLEKEPDLIAKVGRTPAYVEGVLDKIEELHNPEIDKPNIRKRFKDAGMELYYDTAYAHLCDYSHLDTSTIINRPIGLIEHHLDKRGTQFLVGLIVDLILKASIRFHEFLKTGQRKVFEDLQQKWQAALCDTPLELRIFTNSVKPTCTSFTKQKNRLRPNQLWQAIQISEQLTDVRLWIKKADELVSAANLLEVEVLKYWSEIKVQNDRIVSIPDRKNVQEAYFLLIAYALENFLKAFLIHQNQKTLKGRLLKKLPGYLKEHDLVQLASKIKFNIDVPEEEFLHRLSRFSVWAARYPVPIDPDDLANMKKLSDGKAYFVAYYKPQDICTIHNIID